MPLASEVRRPQVLPPRKWILDTSLVLGAPLWHPDLAVSPFLSKNPGTVHSCTVTGALWTSQGRYFDGLDDYISVADAAILRFGTGDFSLEAWIKPTHPEVGNQVFLQKDSNYFIGLASLGYLLDIQLNTVWIEIRDGSARKWGYGGSIPTANIWYHTVAGRISGAPFIYVNGVNQSVTLGGTGNFAADLTNTDALRIGYDAQEFYCYEGTIGEVREYNRVLTAQEIQQNYLATKWRYQ